MASPILLDLPLRRLCPACRSLRPNPRAPRGAIRKFSTSPSALAVAPPLKLAIIGAGPSGFYTASRVLNSVPPDSPNGQGVEVHMYERLPTPYGLVRYGVAPDHPEVKNCQHKFDELSKDPRFKYFGNVLITSQPSIPSSDAASTSRTGVGSTALSSYTYPYALRLALSSLLPHYTSLLLSYGASLSNPLSSVSGSSSSSAPLSNVFPALALVGWYNAHPAFADLPVDLSSIRDVAVVGQGNVALDVARILLKDVKDLEGTDIPDEIHHILAQSKVRKVTATGRRGPGQVAFTTKEFREIVSTPSVRFAGVQGEMMDTAKEETKGDRMRTRLLGLMEKPNKYQEGEKEIKLDFLKSPSAFLPSPSSPSSPSSPYSLSAPPPTDETIAAAAATPRSLEPSPPVHSVEWDINALLPSLPPMPSPPPSQEPAVPASGARGGVAVARPTGEKVLSRADMVVESVGYRSEPLGPLPSADGEVSTSGLPFDDVRGRVRNVGGRVTREDGVVIPGMYAAGWVARGPVGVIASTMHDAYSIADQLLADHFAVAPAPPSPDVSSSSPDASGLSVPPRQPEPGPPEQIVRGLKEGTVVDLSQWGRIDLAERERGRRGGRGKEREKFRRVEEMLAVLG